MMKIQKKITLKIGEQVFMKALLEMTTYQWLVIPGNFKN